MSTTACRINLVEAVQLWLTYHTVTLGTDKLDEVKDTVLSLILDGELEEANAQADSLPDPIRSEIQCAILRLPLQTSLFASNSYQLEASAFAYWFMKLELVANQSLIRAAILRDVLEGFPVLASRAVELLESPFVRDAVSHGLDEVVTAWFQNR